ncbi:MAG: c-type cytochrome [Hyphomicrobiaceae bacterium]
MTTCIVPLRTLAPAAIAAFLLLGSSGMSMAQKAPLPKEGRDILEANCARCHAVWLDGESPMPKAPRLRDIARKYRPQNLAEAFAEGIVTGHPDMPQFVFRPPEINAIIIYLQALRDAKP